jgi:hypothetical protein
VDAVVARALAGPTELTADEIALLLPAPPPDEAYLRRARLGLPKVGIACPASLEIPAEVTPDDHK